MKRTRWIHIFFLVGAFFLVGRVASGTTTEPPAPAGEPVRVILLPDPLVLALGQSQNLVLVAEDADGRKRDVTVEARFTTTGGQLDGNVLTATTPGSFVLQGRYRELTDNAVLKAYAEKPSPVPTPPAGKEEAPEEAPNVNAPGVVAGVATEEPVNANQPQEQTNVNAPTADTNVASETPQEAKVFTRAVALPWWVDVGVVAFIVLVVLLWKRFRRPASKP